MPFGESPSQRRHASLMAILAAVTVVTAVACDSPAETSTPHHIRWGTYLPDLMGSDISSDAGVVGVSTRANRALDLILTFNSLTDPPPVAELNRISAAGAVPILTIEPWKPDAGLQQPDYRLTRIASGTFDDALAKWAKAIADYGLPTIVRFAHEMNGNWYPWAVGVNGNTAADYRAAWIHMHNVMRANGARNAEFLWAPMTPVGGIQAFEQSFPGHDYVDYLGLDGYNWGDDGVHGWATPDYLYSDSLRRLRKLDTDSPILVAEAASADDPNPDRKAHWISQFVTLMSTTSGVDGFIWFQTNKERDWRFNSTAQSELAFRNALASIPVR